ncbi:hypothetical protein RRU01S_07_06240 [Agrobacterium rubi TR3 = NBRC 13261]|uniref:Type IV secretion protein Rhs n=1 Tax=Agrobacterium rubi TR3 = NBRC 13261 TaxID=1368415 RepID=A0A081CTU9_9HYPH|nr:hypothetical protein [Agrobacterium rubi]MBP1878388.1 hypothetical protein [Agrobacterium rubi]GAK70095.1 hypothetical protein RRU01S_07_06240 [Agrobacterium rubi TR3 = NBRC 13261]
MVGPEVEGEVIPIPTPRPQFDEPLSNRVNNPPIPLSRPVDEIEPDSGQDIIEPPNIERNKARHLTQGEVAMARKYFKDSVNYDAVTLKRGNFIIGQDQNTAMTPNGNMYFPGGIYKNDFSTTALGNRSFFIHEMVHVWQHQNRVTGDIRWLGILSMGEYGKPGPYTKTPGKFLYDYRYDPFSTDGALDLTDFGFEQQAAIIEDYYLIINGASPRNAASNYTKDYYDSMTYGLLRNFLRNPSYAKGKGQDRRRRP